MASATLPILFIVAFAALLISLYDGLVSYALNDTTFGRVAGVPTSGLFENPGLVTMISLGVIVLAAIFSSNAE